MSIASRTPSLTPSRSPSPVPPTQPDHFYGSQNVHFPPSPASDGKTWLDPDDDPLAHRGIPVFKPTIDEFENFEEYVTKIECWGRRSGIVKVIPPKEWTQALPALKDQLSVVKIKSPIEQHMLGRGGLFRQENLEKRRILSVREWVELCNKDEFKAPGVEDVGLHARSATSKAKSTSTARKRVATRKSETAEVDDHLQIKQESVDQDHLEQLDEDRGQHSLLASPPDSTTVPALPSDVADSDHPADNNNPTHLESAETETGSAQSPSVEDKLKTKMKRLAQTREAREASSAERAAHDTTFLQTFDPRSHWLPFNTKPSDYTPEFCQKLERQYWRNCGLGKPAWYGADTQGSLYTNDVKSWNVAHLPSALSRLLPASSKGLPGVNTPYLYFGMWRATFAWHVEDMDLFSINFIHFGAPKFWYSIPQSRAAALEQTMRGYFPKDTSQCPQFLRHKSFLASPTLLAQSACRPNVLVQHAGEFVITFPRGYHAGFNLGLNCAESVNFALDSWLELGKKAQACQCVSDSVRIDVNQLLLDREAERLNPDADSKTRRSAIDQDGKPRVACKRKAAGGEDLPKAKKIKSTESSVPKASSSKMTLTLKLGPKPPEPEAFPCCLCVFMGREGLLRVHDPPIGRKDAIDGAGYTRVWLAHEECANIVPETWVDEIDVEEDGRKAKERVVFGVDGIVKDRWNLKCSACSKSRYKAHGAPIQCTKGKCPKAFHVSCARDGENNGIVFCVLREVEKEVVLLDQSSGTGTNSDQVLGQVPAPSGVESEQAPSTSNDSTSICHASGPRVLKVIRKVEVQVLCNQHNPAVAAAKKASKQDKIRNDLVALPPMTRIKIRVSAGVFEVSLIRVIEASKSVEVLWDRGVKREFKWGSVVFGNIDGQTVLQKPSELAPESGQISSPFPVTTFPSVSAAAQRVSTPGTQSVTHGSLLPYTPYQPRRDYQTWAYQGETTENRHSNTHRLPHYPYNGYYRDSSSTTKPYNHTTQYRAQLQWQQPYTGPRPGSVLPSFEPSVGHPPHSTDGASYDNHASTSNQPLDPCAAIPRTPWSYFSHNGVPHSAANPPTILDETQSADEPAPSANDHIPDLAAFKDLLSLPALQPAQIASILRANPDLRDAVWAAIDKQKRKDS